MAANGVEALRRLSDEWDDLGDDGWEADNNNNNEADQLIGKEPVDDQFSEHGKLAGDEELTENEMMVEEKKLTEDEKMAEDEMMVEEKKLTGDEKMAGDEKLAGDAKLTWNEKLDVTGEEAKHEDERKKNGMIK
jgi:hypothetical protein